MSRNIKTIPNFIEAEDPKGLRLSMFKNNVEKQSFFNYFDIQQKNDGRWIAFYFETVGQIINSEAEKDEQ